MRYPGLPQEGRVPSSLSPAASTGKFPHSTRIILGLAPIAQYDQGCGPPPCAQKWHPLQQLCQSTRPPQQQPQSEPRNTGATARGPENPHPGSSDREMRHPTFPQGLDQTWTSHPKNARHWVEVCTSTMMTSQSIPLKAQPSLCHRWKN